MRKAFMGVRLRRLREEKNLKQIELAQALGISASYLNQLEQNQRPLTVPVLVKINSVFGIDVQLFSEDEEARLITELRDALSDGSDTISVAEVRELAMNMPAVGRTLVSLHRRYREAAERSEAMAAQLGDEWIAGGPPRMPFEQVRDFFYARHNHIEPLDEAAERLYQQAGLTPRTIHEGVTAWLQECHGVQVLCGDSDKSQRRYDPLTRTLHVSANLKPGQQTFQMATQLAFLELGDEIDRLANNPILAGEEARRLARIGLAKYFRKPKKEQGYLFWGPRLLGVCAHLLAALSLSFAIYFQPDPQTGIDWPLVLSAPATIVLAIIFSWSLDSAWLSGRFDQRCQTSARRGSTSRARNRPLESAAPRWVSASAERA